MNKIYFQILVSLFLISCSNNKKSNFQTSNNHYPVKLDSIELFDKSRNRKIPVAVFQPKSNQKINNQQVVIFSHGYGENKGGDNMIYSYLTESLASKGYFVISIQHELPTDDLLPMDGVLKVTRKPNWERGTDNILYVLNEFKTIKPELDFKHLTLIGHSNGGDMTAFIPGFIRKKPTQCICHYLSIISYSFSFLMKNSGSRVQVQFTEFAHTHRENDILT